MMSWQNWQTCDFSFATQDEVHLWLIPVEESEKFYPFLSTTEKNRADKFRVPMARQQFVVAHGSLRILLGKYLKIPPSVIQFKLNPFGKPYLEGQKIFFNISHSHEWVLIGLSPKMEIGVDIEKIRQDLKLKQLAKRFFSIEEVEQLNKLPQNLVADGFFNAWTRKEAYIKARGKGMSISLSGFTVNLIPNQPACLLNTIHDPDSIKNWVLSALPVPPNYKAAFVVNGRHFSVQKWYGKHLFKITFEE